MSDEERQEKIKQVAIALRQAHPRYVDDFWSDLYEFQQRELLDAAEEVLIKIGAIQ